MNSDQAALMHEQWCHGPGGKGKPSGPRSQPATCVRSQKVRSTPLEIWMLMNTAKNLGREHGRSPQVRRSKEAAQADH